MEPYRGLFPRAGLMLPHSEDVATRLIVLPNGAGVGDPETGLIWDILALLLNHSEA